MLVRIFPVGPASDAFLGALVIPRILVSVAGIPIMHVSMHFLSRDRRAFENATIYRLAGTLAVVFGAVAALWVLVAPFVLSWLLKGIDGETGALAVRLTRIQAISIPAGVLATYFYGVRQARGEALRSEMAVLIETIITLTILLTVISPEDMIPATFLMALRPAMQMAALVPVRRGSPDSRPALAGVLRDSLPLIGANTYQWIQQLVDRFLSSLTPSGGFTLYYVAQQGWGATAEIINRSVIAPSVPQLSAHAGSDPGRFRADLVKLLWTCAILAVAITFFALALGFAGRPLLSLVPSVLPNGATAFLVVACATSGMLLGFVLETALARAAVVMEWTPRLSALRALTNTAGICFKTIGVSTGGLIGLGIAASVQNLATAAALLIAFKRWMRKRRES